MKIRFKIQVQVQVPLTCVCPVHVVVDPVHREAVRCDHGALVGEHGQVGVAGVYRGPEYSQ